MDIDLVWHAQSTVYRFGAVDLVALVDRGDNFHVLQPVEMMMTVEPKHTTSVCSKPSMTLTTESARSLLQALWDAGLRPAEWEGNDAQVAALQGHIRFAERVTDALLPIATRSVDPT